MFRFQHGLGLHPIGLPGMATHLIPVETSRIVRMECHMDLFQRTDVFSTQILQIVDFG